MRIVLDTNILVSALLTPSGFPATILDLITVGELTPVVDDRILAEYREVLRRPRFSFNRSDVDELVAYLDRVAEHVVAIPLGVQIPDPDDLPFLEVAVVSKVDALITGNKKDYGSSPKGLKISSPAEFLQFYKLKGL